MAATPITVSSLAALMKTYYVEEGRLYMSDSYENRLLMAVPKKRDAQGDTWKQPLGDQQIAGGSGDYATSMANITAGSQVAFNGPWKEHYQGALVEDKVMRLSTTGRGAFQPAMEYAINSARSHYNDATNYQLYRSEDGAIGQLASGSTGNGPTFTAGVGTFTFTSDTSAGALQRLKVGSVFNLSAGGAIGIAAGKAGPLQAGDWTVTAKTDTSVTATPAAGAVSPTGSAFVYVKGDAQNQASGSNITACLAGFESWVPTTNALAQTTFKTVDRSVATQERAGIRVPAAINSSVNEAYVLGGNRAMQFGAKTTHIFCHPTKFAELVNEKQGQQRYVDVLGNPATPRGVRLSAKNASAFGFKALSLNQYGAGGDILIVPDWACQYNVSWMVDLTKFNFTTTKEGWPFVRGQGVDGQDWFRQASTKWLLELFGDGELICADPSKQVAVLHQSNAS